ncbi:unnamed protein product, partial [Musa banksii]
MPISCYGSSNSASSYLISRKDYCICLHGVERITIRNKNLMCSVSKSSWEQLRQKENRD